MARLNCMKKSDESAVNAGSVELEFPDWSGMDDSSARVTADAAFHFCEQYRAMFPGLAQRWQSQRPHKSAVEFVL